jgi:hypothetical protein
MYVQYTHKVSLSLSFESLCLAEAPNVERGVDVEEKEPLIHIEGCNPLGTTTYIHIRLLYNPWNSNIK